MTTYTLRNDSLFLQNQYIYGSERLGSINNDTFVTDITLHSDTNRFERMLGEKQYELSNHLGNVLATITDQKMPVENGSTGNVDYWNSKVVSYSDYYPFGQRIEARGGSSKEYRHGFNGMENDDEMYGEGNALNFGARIYDPRIGRWFSVDPLKKNYPFLSPYSFVKNNPVYLIDLDGRDWDVSNVKVSREKRGTATVLKVTGEATLNIKVVNMSSTNLNMEDLRGQIKTEAESLFSGQGGNYFNIGVDEEGNPTGNIQRTYLESNLKINVNIEVANSMDDVEHDDHLMIMTDELKPGKNEKGIVEDPAGKAQLGGRVALVEAAIAGEGTTEMHEMGHLFNLEHVDNEGNLMYYSSGTDVTKPQKGEIGYQIFKETYSKRNEDGNKYKTPTKEEAAKTLKNVK